MVKKDYATARFIGEHVAEIARGRLLEWSRRGWVRSAKLGKSKQSARLYHIADVEKTLDRIARGLEPSARRRGVSSRRKESVREGGANLN